MRVIAVGLVAALVAFAAGAERIWRRAGRGRGVRHRDLGAWAAGLGVVAAAALGPLDRLAEELLWAHMVQHLLLVVLAPVLLVASRPLLPMSQLVGDRVRRRLRRLSPAPTAVLGLAWALHVAVVLGWHVPAAYGAALADPTVHALEHLTMLSSGTALWAMLLRHDPRGRTAGAAVVAAAGTGMATGAVGVVLVFSPAVAYRWYEATAPAHGITAADDQVLAGMVMWAAGGLAYVVATCALMARWLGSLQRVAARRGGGVAGLVLLLTLATAACTTRGTPVPTAEVLGDIEAGRALTLERGCITCHDIPGVTGRTGRVGPSLAGFADRRTIAGTLPNTPANLIAWLEDPQAIDPGNIMPDVGLSSEEAAAVAAYLSTLE